MTTTEFQHDNIITELDRLIKQVDNSKNETTARFNYVFLLGSYNMALVSNSLTQTETENFSREINRIRIRLYHDPYKSKGDD